jgi:hypothetical protein
MNHAAAYTTKYTKRKYCVLLSNGAAQLGGTQSRRRFARSAHSPVREESRRRSFGGVDCPGCSGRSSRGTVSPPPNSESDSDSEAVPTELNEALPREDSELDRRTRDFRRASMALSCAESGGVWRMVG